MRYASPVILFFMWVSACAAQDEKPSEPPAHAPATQTVIAPFPSTYVSPAASPVLLRGGTILTGTGERVEKGDVLVVNGRIAAIGTDVAPPEGARIIDAKDRWITPGLIEVHSHLGDHASPHISQTEDENEFTNPIRADVWAEHSVWPQDPGFQAALQGGVTTLQVLPGSGNLIGGRGVTLRNVPAASYQEMKFPGAPQALKMACGENPRSVYGKKGQSPYTDMANVAGYRQAFADAQEYQRNWREYRRKLDAYEKKKAAGQAADSPSPPKRDLKMETLVEVLEGRMLVHIHCYRADQIMTLLDVSKEFGFKISAFHHAVEAYKVADKLAEQGVCGALWADGWGSKMESLDGIRENIALVDRPKNSCAIVHSDGEQLIQRMNQEAAKAMARGERIGLKLPPEHAIRWITSNPAKALGIADRVGTLEVGKLGDIVVWNGNPFSVYALADEVLIDGATVFDRAHPPVEPRSDFLLGQPGQVGAR